jgi:Uncharacterized protein conserved in bacteria
VKAGIDIPSDPLEAHYLAGGDVSQVILALIAADKAGISLDYNRACAIDLATKGTGKTVLEAVRTSINPKVIDVPNPSMGRQTIDGVAKDGIGAKVKARVTVRSHLDRFVGGATEETIIARVGEGIVSAIGSADSYKDVLENPDRISKAVLAKGSIATPPSRFFPSISRTWTWATISARNCRANRRMRTSASPRRKRKCGARRRCG